MYDAAHDIPAQDIAGHQAWERFKAFMLYREDRQRRQEGRLPLEAEIAEAMAVCARSEKFETNDVKIAIIA